MKIALPVENGLLCGHFGHAPKFALVDVKDNKVVGSSLETPPPHEPGALPKWLSGLGVTHIICGGIGARAVELLTQAGIEVLAGITPQDPTVLVERFLKGELQGAKGPTCQGHGHGEGHGHSCRH